MSGKSLSTKRLSACICVILMGLAARSEAQQPGGPLLPPEPPALELESTLAGFTGRQPAPEELEEGIAWFAENRQRLERILDTAEQDAPGVDYQPQYDLPPEEVYEYAGFSRQIADYAPPGYEARDQQEGPGEPEFERLVPAVEVTDAERDKFVVRGMYPGSYLAPGTNTSFRIRGFVRLAALYDFDPIGLRDAFVTNSIPVPADVGQNFNMSGRISRFAIETWTPTDFHNWNVHTFIEADFFNGPAQAAGGGGNPLRLRHAFLDFGYFRFGQQNTVFMDPTSWPSLVDFQGPNSWANQRQPSIRVTLPLLEKLYWAGSVERPFSDITTNGLGRAEQDVPDFATHLRFEGYQGHLQLSGLLRTIGYRPNGGELIRETASAIGGSAVFHPWAILAGTDPVRDENPSGWTRSRILMQANWGPGLGRYMNDLAGQGLDAQVDPLTGTLELVEASGWNASYEHWFNEHWLVNYTYSQVSVDNNANQAANTYDATRYQAASLWWIPIPRLSFAVEYIWGTRENLDGQEADARRLHGLAQYNF